MDWKNEIIIFTHIGDNWMIESDANGWETYSELPTQRFQHQYFDDTNLIKNMVFDIDVPTIGAMPGPGFHWDSAFLCDVTIVLRGHQDRGSPCSGRPGSRRRHGPDVLSTSWVPSAATTT